MTPKPTGRLRGDDLVLSRTFRAPIDDVWTSVTSSESTARWFGPWERVPGGDEKKIRVQMIHEEGKPWMDGAIEHCEAPHRFTIRTTDAHGDWHLSMHLTESAGTTTLELIHHRVNRKAMGEVGPGWEYYLDVLVAAREGAPLPKFDAYYPAQKDYFSALA
ncbi:MAG: SRPBCC family protein [Labilithrix sp.]|nr:SRPBCC family protein [Labilithrix sp.]